MKTFFDSRHIAFGDRTAFYRICERIILSPGQRFDFDKNLPVLPVAARLFLVCILYDARFSGNGLPVGDLGKLRVDGDFLFLSLILSRIILI